jgi:hypothetical protein
MVWVVEDKRKNGRIYDYIYLIILGWYALYNEEETNTLAVYYIVLSGLLKNDCEIFRLQLGKTNKSRSERYLHSYLTNISLPWAGPWWPSSP